MREQVRAVEEAEVRCPAIERADALRLMQQCRDLLNEDVTQAALLLRAITGPTTVHLKREPGKASPTWSAEFTVNLVPVLLELPAGGNCPTMSTWEYLKTRGWTNDESEQVWLDTKPTFELIADKASEMHGNGTSISTIASALNTSWETGKSALAFAKTGQQPLTNPAGRKTGKQTGPPKYLAIQEKVVRLLDIKKRSIVSIACELGVSEATVRRSWDSAHLEEIQVAAEEVRDPVRGSYRNLPAAKIDQMREMLRLGQSTTSGIAVAVGVSTNTVWRERQRILDGDLHSETN